MKSYILSTAVLLITSMTFAQKQNNFEEWSNKPEQVNALSFSVPPSDAIVLHNGYLEEWQYANGGKVNWNTTNEYFTVTLNEPDIFTKQNFGSCQLHVEWKVPTDEKHDNLNWGNSGIYLMGLYEVQIYDSYKDKHKIYYNGQAGSIYKQHSPLVNSSKPPGEWQSFDIVFTAPVFNSDKSLKSPAYFTVFQNGVLIQNNVELSGPTTHGTYTKYKYHKEKLPLMLQSHGSQVSYRNIWIRDI